jgi:hypothetical protein
MRVDTPRTCPSLIAPAVVAAAALLCALALVTAPQADAATAPAGTQVVWAGDDEFVRLVAAEPGVAPNDHPAHFAADAIGSALACVRLRKDDITLPLLSPKDAARLAPHLARAFVAAGPTQDVALAAHVRIKGAFLGSQDVTLAARLFVAEGKLQVIVGDLFRSSVAPEFYRSPVGERQIDRRLHPHEPGLRARETRHENTSFELAPGIELHAPGGHPRADWLVLDLAALSQQCAPAVPRNGAGLPCYQRSDAVCTGASHSDVSSSSSAVSVSDAPAISSDVV